MAKVTPTYERLGRLRFIISLEVDGELHPARYWADKAGISMHVLRGRLRRGVFDSEQLFASNKYSNRGKAKADYVKPDYDRKEREIIEGLKMAMALWPIPKR